MRVLLLLIIAFLACLLGSIRSSVVVGRLLRRNVRTLYRSHPGLKDCCHAIGVGGTALAVILEIGKAAAAVLLGGTLLGSLGEGEIGKLFGGFCLMMGSCFPVWYGLHGSRGLLCGLMTVFLADWRVGLCGIAAFLIAVVFTRYVSLSVLAGALLCPVFMWVFGHSGLSGLLVLLCAGIIAVQYRGNILRLLNGTEPRLQAERPGIREIDADN